MTFLKRANSNCFISSDHNSYILHERTAHRHSLRRARTFQVGGEVPALPGRKYQSVHSALIYSTKVSLHNNNNKSKSILVITKNTLWIEEEGKGKKRISFPMKQIVDILKCEDHPEMVIFT